MPQPPRAFLFDVFGTLVDWRTSIARQIAAYTAARGATVDSVRFAMDWRGGYQPAMETVRSGARDYVSLDTLHGENLDAVAAQHGLIIPPEDRADLVRAWHRLDPWRDSVAGLTALRALAPVASLSNGNIALMVNLARHAGFTWDAILGADIARAYKPDPAVYLSAARALDLPAEGCMMVAAHNSDLAAARALGMQTAFVCRPTEYGPGQNVDLEAYEDWDVIAATLPDVAAQLSQPG